MIPAEEITRTEFDELLAEYDSVLDTVASAKGGKSGPKLKQLDDYRYNEAVETFSGKKPKSEMDLDAMKTLVEWKLNHGKFRPTLMSLVSSNDPNVAADTVRKALSTYQATGDPAAAVKKLAELRGIGPATASLLLAVHQPEHVIFFSDEAFYWLCYGGKKASLKYNAKEYQELISEAQKLVKRLNVSAMRVEQVAYVLMRRASSAEPEKPKEAQAKVTKPSSSKKGSTKRKSPPPASEPAPRESAPRRSKRSKA